MGNLGFADKTQALLIKLVNFLVSLIRANFIPLKLPVLADGVLNKTNAMFQQTSWLRKYIKSFAT